MVHTCVCSFGFVVISVAVLLCYCDLLKCVVIAFYVCFFR